jgi:hypothetical protein
MELRENIRNRSKGTEPEYGRRFNTFHPAENDFFSGFTHPSQQQQQHSEDGTRNNLDIWQQQQPQQQHNQNVDYDKLNKPNHVFMDVQPDESDHQQYQDKFERPGKRSSKLSDYFCNIFCCCRCFCLRSWTRIFISLLVYALIMIAILWIYREQLEYEYEHLDAAKWKQYIQSLPEQYSGNTESKKPVKQTKSKRKKEKVIADVAPVLEDEDLNLDFLNLDKVTKDSKQPQQQVQKQPEQQQVPPLENQNMKETQPINKVEQNLIPDQRVEPINPQPVQPEKKQEEITIDNELFEQPQKQQPQQQQKPQVQQVPQAPQEQQQRQPEPIRVEPPQVQQLNRDIPKELFNLQPIAHKQPPVPVYDFHLDLDKDDDTRNKRTR